MKKEKKHRFSILKVIGLSVLFGLIIGGGISSGILLKAHFDKKAVAEAPEVEQEQPLQEKKDNAVNLSVTKTPSNDEREVSVLDVSPIWNNVNPAVVVIRVKSVSTYSFFGSEYEQESEGQGTGIIIAQGDEIYIVTNNHVVNGATEIEAEFIDGKKAKCTLKGTNANNDIAVLTVAFSDVEKETLSAIRVATIGDSSKLACGDMVVAIGNADGQGQSLTVGYVSAVDRQVDISGTDMKLIQTDAAINPGNSGGPLLNAKGELIGINNAKLVSTGIEGIGYAIPISEVVSVINQLMNREEIDYEKSAVLGIAQMRDVTTALSEVLNIPVGVYVMEYADDSPLKKAGVPLYSVITEVNGMTVETEVQLRDVLRYIRGGTKGTVTVKERIRGAYEVREYKVEFGTRRNFE